MIGNWARQIVLRAKACGPLRRLLKSAPLAPWLARAARWFPPADSAYERWLQATLQQRHDTYRDISAPPGLFSLITPVWNTPPEYLRALAESVLAQIRAPDFEWVVLDNGSTAPGTAAVLRELESADSRIRLFRSEENLGIVAGMRYCLERAQGRYVVAVDHDDRLDRDCLAVLTRAVQQHDDPPLLYTDEDHLCGTNRLLPYFKPDWDPVLFFNSAYTAHLGVMDRRLALELDVYGDRRTNSCPDWDAFMRFHLAGYQPVHVPEVLYSWRLHPGSTSANMHSKNDVADSHQAMLERYLESLAHPERFHIVRSPLFAGTPDWWIRRRHTAPRPLLVVAMTADQHSVPQSTVTITAGYPCSELIPMPRSADARILADRLADFAAAGGLVAIIDDHLRFENGEWVWESLGLLERFDDIGLVGGPITDGRGRIVDGGRYFVGDKIVCPDRGRRSEDAGYFHQMWKQHSVDAVSPNLCVFDAAFLAAALTASSSNAPTIGELGFSASVASAHFGKRVVYSPFVSARVDERYAQTDVGSPRSWDRSPEKSRYYPAVFGQDVTRPYTPCSAPQNTCEVG